MIYPVEAKAVVGTVPEIRNLTEHAALEAETGAWRTQRDAYIKNFRAADRETLRQA